MEAGRSTHLTGRLVFQAGESLEETGTGERETRRWRGHRR